MAGKAKPIATANGKPVYAYNAQGKPICGAKKGEKVCGSTILMDNGRCRIHNGGAAKGVLAVGYKGGTSSILFKALPEKLRKGYLASLTDPEQISLEAGIAVLDANTLRILGQLDSGIGGDVYKKLSEGTPELEALLADRFPDWYEVRRAWAKLTDVIEAGTKEASLWSQIQANLEQRRKLTETEQKRQVQLGTTISAREMDTFVTTVLTIVKNKVTDPRMRATVGREILKLVDPVSAAKLDIAQDIVDQQNASEPVTVVTALAITEDIDETEDVVLQSKPDEDELIEPV